MNKPLIVAIRISENIKWDDLKRWISEISFERKEKIYSMKLDLERISSVISELVARKYISKISQTPFEEIEFLKGFHGKPYVKVNNSVHFNSSHSGNWILFSMDTKPIGIDVEMIQPTNELQLARRFFNPREVEQLEKMPRNLIRHHFFLLWCLKESYIKWKGTGLNTPLDTFSFVYNSQNELVFGNNHGDRCFFHSINLDFDHIASVCLSRNVQEVNFQIYEANYFLRTLKK